jgi:hypothetical protein
MPDEKTPKNILRISRRGQWKQPLSGAPPNDAATERFLPPPMRSQAELAPIAGRLAENSDMMKRFKEKIGTDRQRANELIDEIRVAARELDSTITHAEGTRITLILLGMVFGTEGKSNG